MVESAIDVRGLRKSYDGVEAVRGIDLEVRRGEVFALLGPNGAGKTTTVEILEGHRNRSAGTISVLGHDPARGERAFKQKIGIVLQERGVEPYLTVAETVELFRGYYPRARPLDEIIEVVGLTAMRDARVSKLSGGQQRRLDVAIGLAGDPELLFLDEPTTGFDPGARRNAWQMIKNLAALGKTVFLTTHYMDEAQHLADRAAIMVAGEIVAQGPPRSLAAAGARGTRITFRLAANAPRPPKRVASKASVKRRTYTFETREPVELLNVLTTWALRRKVDLRQLSVSHASLEDVYLELTDGQDR